MTTHNPVGLFEFNIPSIQVSIQEYNYTQYDNTLTYLVIRLMPGEKHLLLLATYTISKLFQ